MKVIIPMTGLGSRFKAAGYTDIKPLIPVHGRPIIDYVINLFPGEDDMTFICRNEHLEITPLGETLTKLKPSGTIIDMEGHKLGPVYPVLEMIESVPEDTPILVSYCDFFMHWDYSDFVKSITESGCDGAIPCYTGFHPHLRHEKNVYAGCRINEDKRLLEIKEKHSFEADKTKGHHSAGIYYFKSAKLVKTYFQHLMDSGKTVNNEFYVSMVYEEMLKDGLHIDVYDNIPYFCQLGVPEDLEEYLYVAESIKEWQS